MSFEIEKLWHCLTALSVPPKKKKKKGPKMGVIKVSKDKYISRGVDSEKLTVLD